MPYFRVKLKGASYNNQTRLALRRYRVKPVQTDQFYKDTSSTCKERTLKKSTFTSLNTLMSSASINFNNRCDLSRPKFAKYSSEPCPTDPFVEQRWIMSGAHLMILEVIQNIYKQVDNIPQAEEQNFALFCIFGTQTIEHHHHLEETIIFPMMEPEFKTDVLAEHAAFSEALHGLDQYLKSVLGVKQGKKSGQVIPDPEKPKERFSAATIKRFLEQMVDPLFIHLEHEIGWLEPDKIRSSGLTTERLKAIDVRMEEHIQMDLDTSLLVFVLGHIPPYCQFPKVPWFVRKVLAPWVFYWKNRALWKFFPKSFTQP